MSFAKSNPRSLWLLLYAWASYLLTRLYADFSTFKGYPTMSLDAMVNGTAVRPFVARALVPMIIRWASAHTSEFLQYQMMMGLTSKGFATEFYVHGYSLEKAILLGLTWSFYFATALLMRRLAQDYYRLSDAAGWMAGLASLGFIPLLFTYYSHLYDPATIFFSAALLLACTGGNSLAFGVLLLIASINRETAILFLPVFVAFQWSRLRPLLAVNHAGFWKQATAVLFYSAAMAAGWFAIRYEINQRYAHNAGGVLDFHLVDHNLKLFSVAPMAAFWSLFIALIIAVLCVSGWRQKPQMLRWSLVLIFIPLFAGSLLYGYLEELRVYFELYPLLFLLALPTVEENLGVRLTQPDAG